MGAILVPGNLFLFFFEIMTTHFVGLKNRITYHRGSIGNFHYDPVLERHVWKGEKTSDPCRLVELVNEAYGFLFAQDNPSIIMEVVTTHQEPALEEPIQSELSDSSDSSDETPEAPEEAPEPAEPAEPTPRKRGRPSQAEKIAAMQARIAALNAPNPNHPLNQ
jgi:hypothetical protein